MRFWKMVVVCLAGAVVVSCSQAEFFEVSIDQQDIELNLDVSSHVVEVRGEGKMVTGAGWNYFRLNEGAAVSQFTIGGEPVEFLAVGLDDFKRVADSLKYKVPVVDTTEPVQFILWESSGSGEAEFVLAHSCEFFQDVTGMRFSNEMVGGEVSATIVDHGAYLSTGAFYYPRGAEEMARYRVTACIPSSWESISDGNRLESTVNNGQKVQTWENPFESDGVMFFAAPFVVDSSSAGDVSVYTYFFAEDTSLAPRYLQATVGYLNMYDSLIGPYPYERFTLAENFFPTGYGMPGWTLLGQAVLRLPFIISTSLGHEVLHNWWGNSVFVDYDRGNWCEGVTVYGADYRYKLLSSEEEARDYRKDILKQYVSYVNEGNEFPLREFTSRTSPETRTIGYNKAMMVFHMVEELIGTADFFKAWSEVYADYQGKKVSWEEWMAAFGKVSGEDLSFVIPEWVDRTGAPEIDLRVDSVVTLENGFVQVAFTLKQKGPDLYRLRVPIRFSSVDAVWDTSVTISSLSKSVTMTMPSTFKTIEVDPEYNLFRRLYPEEVEPVISAIIGNKHRPFVSFTSEKTVSDSWSEFALNFSGDSVKIDGPEILETGDTSGVFPVVLNPHEIPGYLAKFVEVGPDSIAVNGVVFPRAGHTFVLTGQDWMGFEKYLAVVSSDAESLPRVGQLLSHYGKYSYLVFEGGRNVGKGQWPVDSSPLKKPLSQ